MKNIAYLMVVMVLAMTGVASAQGMMSDLMSGKLVNPEVGVFAWYNLKDHKTGQEYFLRQAIVGTEKVKRKDAYWLETELVPRIGFSSVYKMLLTGPASDPKNVHRLLVREGEGLVQEIEMTDPGDWEDEANIPRELIGMETFSVSGADVEAEHYTVKDGTGQTDIWISDKIPPMGLVKMKNPEGELILQRFGVGGKDGESALPGQGTAAVTESEEPLVETPPAEPEKEAEKTRKSNFSGRKRLR